MSEGFPVISTKKIYFKGVVTELLWFLSGSTNVKFLVDNDCHIWDGDCYQAYLKGWEHAKKLQKSFSSEEEYQEYLSDIKILTQEEFINRIKTDDEFAYEFGNLGKIYGHQWRNWDVYNQNVFDSLRYNKKYPGIDQITNLINDLKTNPDSRRLMVNAWNPSDLETSVLPPCHYGFQVYTRELSIKERAKLANENNYNNSKIRFGINPEYVDENDFELVRVLNVRGVPKRAISLMYNARSQDVPLGTPFNISSYGLLLEIIGKMVNMVPDELIANMGDCHIYLNQIDGIKEQLTREPYPLATLKHSKTDDFYKSLSDDLSLLTHLTNTDFELENYQSHPTIKMPLSN
jgi:thymidylate synthase